MPTGKPPSPLVSRIMFFLKLTGQHLLPLFPASPPRVTALSPSPPWTSVSSSLTPKPGFCWGAGRGPTCRRGLKFCRKPVPGMCFHGEGPSGGHLVWEKVLVTMATASEDHWDQR